MTVSHHKNYRTFLLVAIISIKPLPTGRHLHYANPEEEYERREHSEATVNVVGRGTPVADESEARVVLPVADDRNGEEVIG